MRHHRGRVDEERLARLLRVGGLLDGEFSKELCLMYICHRLRAVVGGSHAVIREVNIVDGSVIEIILTSKPRTEMASVPDGQQTLASAKGKSRGGGRFRSE